MYLEYGPGLNQCIYKLINLFPITLFTNEANNNTSEITWPLL